MTTLTQQLNHIPVDEIADEAGQVSFGRFAATAITACFVTLGWIAGASWYGVRYCAVAVRYGWRQGARSRRVPKEPQARGNRPGPGGTVIETG